MIDKMLEKYGYKKSDENKYGACYCKDVSDNYSMSKYRYIQELYIVYDIMREQGVVQSLEQDKLSNKLYDEVWIEPRALPWIWLKYITLKLKYKWQIDKRRK